MSEEVKAPKSNETARVYVDRDIRMPKALHEQLPLEPGERWKFSIVGVKPKEFTIKAVRVEG